MSTELTAPTERGVQTAVKTAGVLSGLSLVRPPAQILAEAKQAADALMQVIAQQKKVLKFNEEIYLQAGDWQTVGGFFGCTADLEWTRPIRVENDKGEVATGWEARVAIVRGSDGAILGHGEAMCLNDEEKWSARPKYEWHYKLRSGGTSKEDPGKDEIIWENNPGKFKADGKTPAQRPVRERVQVDDGEVPSFQLRSMAQTRAGAKGFSNVFRWVVTMAGFKGTPAEEMIGQAVESDNEHYRENAPKQTGSAPQGQSQQRGTAAPPPPRQAGTGTGQKPAPAAQPAGKPAAAPAAKPAAAAPPVIDAQTVPTPPATPAAPVEAKWTDPVTITGMNSIQEVTMGGRKAMLYGVQFSGAVEASDGKKLSAATMFAEAVVLAVMEAEQNKSVVRLQVVPAEERKGAYLVAAVQPAA
jgi:hypothetical protein